jgi:hypothetical protein
MADPTAAQVYAAAQQALAFADTFIDQMAAFWSTAVDGGFHADGTPSTGPGDPLAGFVPITNPAGVTTYQPSYAKLSAGVAPAALNQRITAVQWFEEG